MPALECRTLRCFVRFDVSAKVPRKPVDCRSHTLAICYELGAIDDQARSLDILHALSFEEVQQLALRY